MPQPPLLDDRYLVTLEVAGPVAIFSRPDTGATPTSYPAPTWSAAKGIFEAIAYFQDGAAWFCPIKTEICRNKSNLGGDVRYERYTTNYGGPLRKKDLFRKGTAGGGSSMQLFATVLTDVCYRLHAVVLGPTGRGRINARHHLKDLFERRLKQGRCHRTPVLGWSEFTCSYWGPPRTDVTEPDDGYSAHIPSMLLGVWNRPNQGGYKPTFQQDVSIHGGILEYQIPNDWLIQSSELGAVYA